MDYSSETARRLNEEELVRLLGSIDEVCQALQAWLPGRRESIEFVGHRVLNAPWQETLAWQSPMVGARDD